MGAPDLREFLPVAIALLEADPTMDSRGMVAALAERGVYLDERTCRLRLWLPARRRLGLLPRKPRESKRPRQAPEALKEGAILIRSAIGEFVCEPLGGGRWRVQLVAEVTRDHAINLTGQAWRLLYPQERESTQLTAERSEA